MKFLFSDEWLDRKLGHCNDVEVSAAGTTLDEFKKIVKQRTVTPRALDNVPTELGKVVRFVREQKSWSTAEMADLADVDESDIQALETLLVYDLKPRTVVRLADLCQFSKEKFIELARHRTPANDGAMRFAAHSKGMNAITDIDYEAVRALVEALSAQK